MLGFFILFIGCVCIFLGLGDILGYINSLCIAVGICFVIVSLKGKFEQEKEN